MELKIKKKMQDILDFLKNNGEQLEYKVAFAIHSSYVYTKHYLEDLEKAGLVEKRKAVNIKGGSGTFWKLKE